MSQELVDLDIGKVMGWLDGEIQAIEKQEPLAVQEDAQGPQDNVMIAAGQDFQESKDGTEKINLPPDTGKRKGKDTVSSGAIPFLRRKAIRGEDEEDVEDENTVEKTEEPTNEKIESLEQKIAENERLSGRTAYKISENQALREELEEEKAKVEKSIDGLKAWAFIEKAMGTPDEDPLNNAAILTAFGLDPSFDLDGISEGTLLKQMLSADTRPSLEWWGACMDLVKELPGISESGAFAASLYHRTDSFDVSNFIEKTGGDDTSESGINITVLGYQTKNFDICPGSVAAFRKIEESLAGVRDPELRECVVNAAKKTDTFLGLEKTFCDRGKADPNEIERMIKLYAHVAYLVGGIAEKLCISLKNDFVFAITHISDALPMMEREMVLEKSLPPSAEQVYRAELVAKATGKEDCGCPPDSVTTGAVLKDEEGVAKVDDLIYTEDDDMELCQKCASDIEKCGHKQDRKDLESPSEDGPMDRAESRPNIIMRDQACGCDHECPPPCKCEAILKEELVPEDHIAVKNVKRSKLPDSGGPRGDAAEHENVAAAGGDVPEGFGLSNEGS